MNLKELFVLVNYKTRDKLLCSWHPQDHLSNYYGQNIYYIGVTNGLGGFNTLIKNGYTFRKKYIPVCHTNKLKQKRNHLIKYSNELINIYRMFVNKKWSLTTDQENFLKTEYFKIQNRVKNIK